MSPQCDHAFAGACVPQFDCRVLVAACQEAAIGGERDAPDYIARPLQYAEIRSAARIPQLDRTILTTAYDHALVRGEGHAIDLAGVPFKCMRCGAAVDVP